MSQDENRTEQEEPLSKEWLAEIARRADKALEGEPGIPWEQVQEHVRERFDSIRRRRLSK
jgi:hypothetical protein